MTETTEGIVASLKRDRKGLKLEDGEWYSNGFMPEINHVGVGDKVKITYKVNGSYKNYETVEVLEKAKPSQVSKGNEYDPTGMLVSYVKDLAIASGKPMRDHLVEVVQTYETIRLALGDEKTMDELTTVIDETKIETIKVK